MRRSLAWWLGAWSVGLGVAAWAVEKKPAKIDKAASSLGQPGEIVRRTIEVGEVVDVEFDRSGFWDESGKYEHEYAGETCGFLSYAFPGVDRPLRKLSITARLSAERGDNAGKPEETSDVTASVNGVEIETRTVLADNGLGESYTFALSDPKLLKKMNLKPGPGNLLKLEIKKTAKNQRGMCVYGRSVGYDDPDPGAPILVQLEVGAAPKKK